MNNKNIDLNKEFKFVLFIPLINIIADIFTNYYEPGTLNPGSIRASIIILFLIYFFGRGYKLDAVSKFILAYVIYLIILSFFSTNVLFSLFITIKASISFLMFIIGYFYINNVNRFNSLNKIYLIVIIIIILNLLITNYFHLGESSYIDATFYYGSARVNITKTLAALLICSPLIILTSKGSNYHKLIFIILLISLVLIFIGVKRAAVLSVLVASILYLILTPRKGKQIKYLTYASIILFITSPLYLLQIEQRFIAREDRLALRQETLETEARYNEVFMVLDAFQKEDIPHKLFGSELFNDRAYFNTIRMLHTDYMTLLNGSGLIGMFFFFGVYIMIIREKNKYYRFVRDDKLYREFNAVFWAILISMLILSIAGTIHEIGSRAFMFMYLGAILRLMKEGYKSKALIIQSRKDSLIEQKKELSFEH